MRHMRHMRHGDPIPTDVWAAGFSFSRAAALIHDAPYPPPGALPNLFLGGPLCWPPLPLPLVLMLMQPLLLPQLMLLVTMTLVLLLVHLCYPGLGMPYPRPKVWARTLAPAFAAAPAADAALARACNPSLDLLCRTLRTAILCLGGMWRNAVQGGRESVCCFRVEYRRAGDGRGQP